MTKRKFYKTTLTVQILSEDPFEYDDLNDVAYAISQGDCSGQITNEKTETLNGKEVAKALKKQGSDPGFFQVDKEGNDEEDPS